MTNHFGKLTLTFEVPVFSAVRSGALVLMALAVGAAALGAAQEPTTTSGAATPRPRSTGDDAGLTVDAKAALPLEHFHGLPVPTLDTAPKIDPDSDVYESLESAREALEDGELTRAAEQLDRALDLATENYAELFHLMAVVKQQMGASGEARAFAERAAALEPGNVSVDYLLGTLLRSQGLAGASHRVPANGDAGRGARARQSAGDGGVVPAWRSAGRGRLSDGGARGLCQLRPGHLGRASRASRGRRGRGRAGRSATRTDRPAAGSAAATRSHGRRRVRDGWGTRARPGRSVPSAALRRRAARRRAGRSEFRLLPAAADG